MYCVKSRCPFSNRIKDVIEMLKVRSWPVMLEHVRERQCCICELSVCIAGVVDEFWRMSLGRKRNEVGILVLAVSTWRVSMS